MSAFLIAKVTIKDGTKFQEYAQKSGSTITAYNGEILMKGVFVSSFSNEKAHNATAIIKFPSLFELNAWYESAEYQKLIALRDEAAVILFNQYEVPTS